ncbi:BEACH domain containing protein lvsE, putative [Acanthamoeba castellanii str. Neff]|uniref:BEACH domain containing protein lvsE, putative n=1 Tax=Acanthamoeba castellanii (strain ATCC 30010 / Neff) TaxID=1257118 RepID=L8HD06_ACACF|nr:BEACH domain containing protein lvsE, putative [Acanthamoeba castellanii str. Neff]ELR23097.1 BEACH domain containing protein lvsE, putative [Acanthamoeba castellanii str. Neff]
MEGPSQDDGALITEQIIEELRQEREREEMEEREWDSKDLNANFVDLLLTIEEDVPSGELFSFLFDLLEEYSELAPHEAESRTGKGQELDFFSVFFQLLPRCGTSLQVVLLKRLNDLVSESDRVKGYCCQRGWVTRLLHMLHYQPLDSEVVLRELFILMESLGSFSLSSKELKQLLRFLYGQTTPDFEDSGAASDDSPEGKQLLQELYPPVQRIVKKQERRWPSCFWDFNGRENKSGVMIPTWKSVWPLNDGYSFCAWLSISSNKDVLPLNRGRRSLPPEQATIRPHLFSFACDDGRGMELFFVSQYLVVLSRQGKNKHAWIKFNYRFKKERWYFVAVAHIYHFLRRSEVLLYVNGQLVEQQYLIYPKIDRY